MTETRGKEEKRRVFITGGRRGIGRAIAYAFAEKGHDVIVNDVAEDEAARETLDGIKARGARTFPQGGYRRGVGSSGARR